MQGRRALRVDAREARVGEGDAGMRAERRREAELVGGAREPVQRRVELRAPRAELQVGGGPQDDTVAEWVQLLNADRVFASVCVASVVGGTRLRISSIQRRKVAVRSTAEGVEFEVEEDPPLAISTPLPRHVPWPLWGYE